MAIQTNIPANLTNAERALIFQELDGELNSKILYALLQGPFVCFSRYEYLIIAVPRHVCRNHCCNTVECL